ncbi:MAG: L,D-transpeptidase family protein [Nannocystaceae bacterium]
MTGLNGGGRFDWQTLRSRVARGLGACSMALLASSAGCSDAAATPDLSPREPSELRRAASPDGPAAAALMTREQPAPRDGLATERAPDASARLREAVQVAEPAELELAPIPAAREPIAIRTARQRLTVRIAPDHGAPRRARIPRGESFEVFELVEGRGCEGKGWADVGNGGFVCLANSRKASAAPRTMPAVDGDGVMPFYFASIPQGETARRWSSLASYRRGDEPRSISAPGTHFAFESRFRDKGQIVFLDPRGRVMLEQDLRRYRPSTFAGHDLEASPVPRQQTLGWAVSWPETMVYATPDAEGELYEVLDYHAEIYVKPQPVQAANSTWYELVDGGFISARNLRRFEPPAALPDEALADDEVWLDIELDEQVLTVMRGSTPVFATLVSTGLKGPTPRGLFRINKKEAFGSMSSAPGAVYTYAVEAVPYVQYFHGGIALHSAYWHDRFGHEASHGCVNLSPQDSAYVYSLTSPHPRDGWIEVYEDEGDLGTRVRVRRGDAQVADRRGPVEYVQG